MSPQTRNAAEQIFVQFFWGAFVERQKNDKKGADQFREEHIQSIGAVIENHCPPPPLKAVAKLLDYCWTDEERHYSSKPSERHIFVSLKSIRGWMEKFKKPKKK